MGNVVSLFSSRLVIEDKEDPVMEFVNDYLVPWALEYSVDIESMNFKLNAAGIMTMLQGILLEDV